ncbi:hypothetical protein JCM11641_004486 [Rhodosporidiobolus odoratus]
MGKKSKSTADAAPPAGLSSFLLGQAAGGVAPLFDDLFANSKGATTAFEPKKPAPRPAAESPARPSTSSSSKASKRKQSANDEDVEDDVLSEPDSDASLGDLNLEGSDEDDEENEDGVEEAYAARLAAERIKAMQGKQAGLTAKGTKRKAEDEMDEIASDVEEVGEGEEDESSENEDEDEEMDEDEEVAVGSAMDINKLVLGSLNAKKDKGKKAEKAQGKDSKDKKQSEKKAKRADETPEERDARTVFLGNVPADCSTSKSMKKALVRHVLQNPALSLPSSCPPLKLDSIRFRSLAFASKVFGRKETAGRGDGEEGSPEAGGRGRKRAREWREAEGSDERGVKGGFKAREEKPRQETRAGALTDAQKRRVAFIRGELNEGKKACNAYLVIESLPEEVDIRTVINALVATANNSSFHGMTLHADVVRPRSAAALLAAAQMAARPNTDLIDVPKNAAGDQHQVSATEARRTVFIGGLDFAENEENVRSATEAVLVRERGESDSGYVESVRIVRDASSGLGKGFCYVLLADEQCVDELLALPPGKNLKISKRKVRLERCKTSAAAARSKAAQRTAVARAAATSAPAGGAGGKAKPVRLAAPRDPSFRKSSSSSSGNPVKQAHQAQLAEALAKLPGDERKKIKSLDAERVARRAQKKEQKRLAERFERKQSNAAKQAGGGAAGEILGRAPRAMERARKEKKRIKMESKSTLKKKSAR